ncbi:hypothetical protein VP01_2148g2 [Puccinia sorghi]|uniref:Uncharacterized protein n=1 Tax=Puccinia sorghi TaxID=27349 RepID=A0A0L6V9L5_9BASI|nr:hypothetical protein VP01_2148g2 [Puccinia sorghi]
MTHWHKVKKVWQYLKGTADLKLMLTIKNPHQDQSMITRSQVLIDWSWCLINYFRFIAMLCGKMTLKTKPCNLATYVFSLVLSYLGTAPNIDVLHIHLLKPWPLMSPSLMKKKVTLSTESCPVFYYMGHYLCVMILTKTFDNCLITHNKKCIKNLRNQEKLFVYFLPGCCMGLQFPLKIFGLFVLLFFVSSKLVVVLDMDGMFARRIPKRRNETNKKSERKYIERKVLGVVDDTCVTDGKVQIAQPCCSPVRYLVAPQKHVFSLTAGTRGSSFLFTKKDDKTYLSGSQKLAAVKAVLQTMFKTRTVFWRCMHNNMTWDRRNTRIPSCLSPSRQSTPTYLQLTELRSTHTHSAPFTCASFFLSGENFHISFRKKTNKKSERKNYEFLYLYIFFSEREKNLNNLPTRGLKKRQENEKWDDTSEGGMGKPTKKKTRFPPHRNKKKNDLCINQ